MEVRKSQKEKKRRIKNRNRNQKVRKKYVPEIGNIERERKKSDKRQSEKNKASRRDK